MKPQEAIKTYLYPVLALASTLSVISLSASLLPIAKWASIQNDCIDRTVAFKGLPDKVWSCNGGGE